ncbi:hypothetical protein E2C01_023187 [Portunus trituberculatus]|uniref:Uncharacterized protein n=1 Tax=Portunus trituberculatus TaxID=210409 RepID=A0A5B7EAW3_PORTR|nr:hypothetical protein [Portunus trituberculatus]
MEPEILVTFLKNAEANRGAVPTCTGGRLPRPPQVTRPARQGSKEGNLWRCYPALESVHVIAFREWQDDAPHLSHVSEMESPLCPESLPFTPEGEHLSLSLSHSQASPGHSFLNHILKLSPNGLFISLFLECRPPVRVVGWPQGPSVNYLQLEYIMPEHTPVAAHKGGGGSVLGSEQELRHSWLEGPRWSTLQADY